MLLCGLGICLKCNKTSHVHLTHTHQNGGGDSPEGKCLANFMSGLKRRPWTEIRVSDKRDILNVQSNESPGPGLKTTALGNIIPILMGKSHQFINYSLSLLAQSILISEDFDIPCQLYGALLWWFFKSFQVRTLSRFGTAWRVNNDRIFN